MLEGPNSYSNRNSQTLRGMVYRFEGIAVDVVSKRIHFNLPLAQLSSKRYFFPPLCSIPIHIFTHSLIHNMPAISPKVCFPNYPPFFNNMENKDQGSAWIVFDRCDDLFAATSLFAPGGLSLPCRWELTQTSTITVGSY